MKTWLVFVPADGGKNSETAEKIVFLREKFSWPALFFTPLWLLWHRLWIGFLFWLAAMIVLGLIAQWLGLNPTATAFVLWLPSLIIAFEASELRRRKLVRKQYRDAGVVMADEIEDAEQRFFEEWVKDENAVERPLTPPDIPSSTKPGPASSIAPQGNPVIGLFPEPGARR